MNFVLLDFILSRHSFTLSCKFTILLLSDTYHFYWIHTLSSILVANLDCLLELAISYEIDILKWIILGKDCGPSDTINWLQLVTNPYQGISWKILEFRAWYGLQKLHSSILYSSLLVVNHVLNVILSNCNDVGV